MGKTVEGIYCLDIREMVSGVVKAIGTSLKKPSKQQPTEIALIVERIINDLTTRMTHWANNDLHIDTDQYLPLYDSSVVTVDEADRIFDQINHVISTLEREVDSMEIFPTWGYPTVKVLDGNAVIVVTGDYRIDDWMRQHQRRLKRKPNEVYTLQQIIEE